jgi:hypothetical protein
MSLLLTAAQHTVTFVQHALAADPSPAASGGLPDLGSGTAPPGSAKVVTVLRWGLWAVTIACVAGVLLSSGRMAVQYRSQGGGGGEAMTGLVWTLIACVIAASATGIVGALI